MSPGAVADYNGSAPSPHAKSVPMPCRYGIPSPAWSSLGKGIVHAGGGLPAHEYIGKKLAVVAVYSELVSGTRPNP